MRGLVWKTTLRLSRDPGGAIDEALDNVPDEIDGQPTYVCGILLSSWAEIQAGEAAQNASQRELAAALGTVQCEGAGINLARQALRGDELLALQYGLGLGPAWQAAGDHGVVHAISGVAEAQETDVVAHHVLLPFAPKAFAASYVGRSSRFDGALDSALFSDSAQLSWSAIGRDALISDNVTFQNKIYCRVSVALAVGSPGEAPLAPLDVRIRQHGILNGENDPQAFRLGQLADVQLLQLLSHDIPTGPDSNPLGIQGEAEDSNFEVALDGVTVLEAREGRLLMPWARAEGVDPLPRADEPESMAPIYSSIQRPLATTRMKGSQIEFSGFTAESEGVRLISYTHAEASAEMLERWRQLRGYTTSRPVVPAGAAGLPRREAVGLPSKFSQTDSAE
jgi:hypothetical protein